MSTSRRDFLKTSLMTGAAIGLSNIPTLGNDLASLQAPSTKNKNVVGLACEPIPKVRIGFIGLGMRGPDAVDRMMKIEGVEIKALGDLMPDKKFQGRKTSVLYRFGSIPAVRKRFEELLTLQGELEARNNLTLIQKTLLFCAVALARVSINLLRAVFSEVD